MRPISLNELKTFRAYARRVRHIVHKEHVCVDSNLLTLLSSISITSGVLQHLRSVQVSASNYTALQQSFALSPQLERLDCHLGFSSRKTFSVDGFCDYIDRATATSSRLQNIAIRGHGLPRLNTTISLLTHLSSVSLRMGNSLLPETVKALLAFPSLLELELHAGHVELNELLSIGSLITFPVLRKLNVRGHSPVITFLLECLQPHTIANMKLEFEDHTLSSESWRTITDLLTRKAHKSLRSLTIEHHREAQDEDDSQHNSDVAIDNAEDGALISDDTPLSSLCKLTYLSELLLDMVSPPRLYDKDVKTLATWWPHIERLDLGSMATDARCKAPLATISCLPTFAQFLPNLKQLSLALSPGNISQSLSLVIPGSCSVLERLYVGCPFPHDAGKLAEFLVSIFPSLKVIDGVDGNWEATQKELDALKEARGEH